MKQRIDRLMVDRGLAVSHEKAQALLMAGQVLVNDRLVTKPGTSVPEDSLILLKEQLPYVSRGGLKLAHALRELRLDVRGAVALDVGASTGGFTDCLLKSGAQRVYTLDVGYGQLDFGLRMDPRVGVLERMNARYPFSLPERVDMATVDVSFISLTKVLPSVAEHLQGQGLLLPLVKPQFEAERGEVGKGGVIRDPRLHARVLQRFLLWVVERGWRLRGLVASPILGDAGNREFFVLLQLDGKETH